MTPDELRLLLLQAGIEVDPEKVAELHQVYAHVEIMIARVNVHNTGEPMHVFRPVE
jgi:hypothetical protein